MFIILRSRRGILMLDECVININYIWHLDYYGRESDERRGSKRDNKRRAMELIVRRTSSDYNHTFLGVLVFVDGVRSSAVLSSEPSFPSLSLSRCPQCEDETKWFVFTLHNVRNRVAHTVYMFVDWNLPQTRFNQFSLEWFHTNIFNYIPFLFPFLINVFVN